MKNNPTLLTLMKMGCKVIFHSEFYPSGDTETKYINIGTAFGHEGCWNMSRDGVKSALDDERKHREEQARKAQ